MADSKRNANLGDADHPAAMARECAALATNDLLDCDCGEITLQMKIRILAERDNHTANATRKRNPHDSSAPVSDLGCEAQGGS